MYFYKITYSDFLRSISRMFCMLVLTLLLFTSCTMFRVADKMTSYDVTQYQWESKTKQVRFIGMSHIASPEFYENVRRSVYNAKKEGYALVYEYVDYKQFDDSLIRKMRRIIGFLPNAKVYERILNVLTERGYQIQNNELFKNQYNNLDFNLDISAAELVKAYEDKYGIIKLKQEDFDKDLTKTVKPLASLNKLNAIILDYRNEQLAKKIEALPYAKILVLYGDMHKEGLLDELKKQDATFKETNHSSTAYNLDYVQVPSADSIRKQDKSYIVHDGYIDKMGQYMNLSARINTKDDLFSFKSGEDEYFLMPNTKVSIEYSLHYHFLSVWLTLPLSATSVREDISRKGETKGINLGFSLNGTHWVNAFNFHYLKGFYLQNTSDFDLNWKDGDKYVQFSKMKYTGFEGITKYKLNKHYSIKSYTTQMERQLHSTGTFIATINYKYYSLSDNSYNSILNIDKSNNYELGLTYGYYYNWVIWRNLYLNLGLAPGLGVVFANVNSNAVSKDYQSAMFLLETQSTLGYNGDQFYSGIGFYFRGGDFFDNIALVNSSNHMELNLFMGYRLNPPRRLRQIRF